MGAKALLPSMSQLLGKNSICGNASLLHESFDLCFGVSGKTASQGIINGACLVKCPLCVITHVTCDKSRNSSGGCE